MISELCHFIQTMLQHPPEYKEVCLLHPDFSLLSSLTLQAVMSENRFEVRTTQLSNTKTGMLYEEMQERQTELKRQAEAERKCEMQKKAQAQQAHEVAQTNPSKS